MLTVSQAALVLQKMIHDNEHKRFTLSREQLVNLFGSPIPMDTERLLIKELNSFGIVCAPYSSQFLFITKAVVTKWTAITNDVVYSNLRSLGYD